MQRAIFPWAVMLVALLATTGAAGAGVRHITDATQLSAGVGLLRSIAVGQNPIAIALDEQSNGVFILNQGPFDWYGLDQNGHPTGQASVSMPDATTGAVPRTTQLGVRSWRPSLIAVVLAGRDQALAPTLQALKGNGQAL